MGMRSTDTAGGGWNGRGAELVLGRRWWGWRGAFGNQPQRQSGLLRQLPSQSLLEQRERERPLLSHTGLISVNSARLFASGVSL